MGVRIQFRRTLCEARAATTGGGGGGGGGEGGGVGGGGGGGGKPVCSRVISPASQPAAAN